MRQWLAGMVAAAVISSMAMLLTPAGRVRTVTKLVCGVMCALAIAGPIMRLDAEKFSVNIAAYEQAAQKVTQSAEEEANLLERTYIEDQCAAYILSKATGTQAALTGAKVSARWDDGALVWYPWAVELQGEYNRALSAAIEAELGIPARRQSWSGGAADE